MSRHLDLVRSFLEQLEARDCREGEILGREFRDIKARSVAWKTGGVCSTKVGNRPGNTKKNRYKDVVPYDETRVILSLLQEEGHGDYINANFIRRKCERYWAQEQGPLQTGPFCITLESRSVHQLQYMSWPDHGVPSNSDHILTMVEEARRLHGAGPGPLCIHCSAGCGRTGVLCAVDYVRQLLLTQTIPPNFNLFDVVLEMRKQRPAAVQTEEQYRFLYHTVAQLFSRTLQNTSPHRQKLKENCAPIGKDSLSLRISPEPSATSRPPGGVLSRSISVPGSQTRTMADTYAVVQKRGAPAGAGRGTRVPSSTDTIIYSQVTPRSQRPVAHTEDATGTTPPGRGFNLRIGRPKGPRDPPAEWTRV
ncbi:hypothetical protein ACRRTK_021882 [Alexandromys fortis]